MSFKIIQTLTNNQTSTQSEAELIENSSLVSVQVVSTNATPSAKTFADADVTPATDLITITSHGLVTGLLGRLTSSGALPAGLALSTDYFVIKVSDNTIKLASSYANALAGTAVDITAAAGTGTHTFTPTALNAIIKLQASVDGNNWHDISGATATITATSSSLFSFSNFAEPLLRTSLTQTSGQGLLTLQVHTFKK